MIWVCMGFLLLCSIAGFWLAFRLAQLRGEFLNIGTLLLINYTLVQPISGLVHLADIGGEDRGYFDLLKSGLHPTVMATFCAVFGLAALAYGTYRGGAGVRLTARPMPRSFWLGDVELLMLCGVLVALGPVAYIGFQQISSYVAGSGLERIIQVDGGMARYAYLSQWLVWVISIGALLVAGRQRRLGELSTLIVVGLGAVAIAVVMRWTGGRSIVIVLALPLIVALLPRYAGLKRSAFIFGSAALLGYVTILSQIRSAALKSGGNASFAGWLDWEGGRFSMTGFAAQYTANHGFLKGETLLNALAWTIKGLSSLAGMPLGNSLRSSSEITGGVLLEHAGGIFIVPGMSAEFYMNFGLPGVIAGYLALGWAGGYVDRRIARAPSVIARLTLAFIGSLLVFRTIPADSSALPSFILFLGSPLLAIWGMSTVIRATIRPRRPVPAHARPVLRAVSSRQL